MEIIRGKIPCAKKVILYGPEGIGKSTFAAQFPDPLFIDTEGSTKAMDVARTPAPTSWAMLMDQVRYVKEHPEICRTLIIDTADWAEALCIRQICDKKKVDSIEAIGYGKGYVYVQEEFGRLLNQLEEVIGVGINVVLTAHAKMRKFEQPDEMGAYDRWEMKLTKQTAPMVKEWADMVLFANYKTFVVNVDGQGAQKGKNKAQGGRRVMFTTHHSCWDAKNRYGLPDEVPFEYASIAPVIESGEGKKECAIPDITKGNAVQETMDLVPDVDYGSAKTAAPAQKAVNPEPGIPIEKTEPVPDTSDKSSPPPAMPAPGPAPVGSGPGGVTVDPRVPKALRDLMIANQVDEWNLQTVCEAKGYIPNVEPRIPIWDYERVSPGFIDGCLVAAWPQVLAEIRKIEKEGALVFN